MIAALTVFALGAFLLGIHFLDNRDACAFIFPDEALPTFSGYLPLNRSASVLKMFYAYYEAIEPRGTLAGTPILLWLQGGPGCSSMTGNFYEFGPWRTAPDLELHKNDAPWNYRFGVLFIDNPVGSGYSIAESDEDVPVNEDQVANDLHAALELFFRLQPALAHRPFFIAGESYAGKYVPALSHYIMRLKLEGETDSPLRLDGLIIGNGLTDPIIQVQAHAGTAYSFGLLDSVQSAQAEAMANKVVALVEKEDWQAAYTSRAGLINWIENVTGLATLLDIRRRVPYHCREDDGTDFLGLFLNRKEVRAAMKADDAAEGMSCNPRVGRIMSNDRMKSVKWMVEELLVHFPVLLYQGQYDLIDGVVSSEEWMKTLKWEGREEFYASKRSIWRVGSAIAGYWKSYGMLTHVVVLGAGHMVPADQGLHSQHMIQRWIEEQLQQKR